MGWADAAFRLTSLRPSSPYIVARQHFSISVHCGLGGERYPDNLARVEIASVQSRGRDGANGGLVAGKPPP